MLIVVTSLIRASSTPRPCMSFNWRYLVIHSFTGNKRLRERHLQLQTTLLDCLKTSWKTMIKARLSLKLFKVFPSQAHFSLVLFNLKPRFIAAPNSTSSSSSIVSVISLYINRFWDLTFLFYFFWLTNSGNHIQFFYADARSFFSVVQISLFSYTVWVLKKLHHLRFISYTRIII